MFTTIGGTASGGIGAVTQIPTLARDNARLRGENERLRSQDAVLRERLSTAAADVRFDAVLGTYPKGIPARIVGYDPENSLRVVTIDRGAQAGVVRNEGVVAEGGVVGRVIETDPFTSKVLLLTDFTSNVPAVVQRGRWWGIAKGSLAHVQLQYISQDAQLKTGDTVVTGEGRSFHAGIPIGRIIQISHAEGELYQSAIVEPAVAFGALEHVIVVPK